MFAVVVVLAGACGNDGGGNGGGVTDPEIDVRPPSVSFTVAPQSTITGDTVTVGFTATDDVDLQSVSVRWGTPGTPLEVVPAVGRTFSGSCQHIYFELGLFTIQLTARDASGNEASESHEILVSEPDLSAPTNVAVNLDANSATISWSPGSGATSQQVVLSHQTGLEPERVRNFADNTTSSVTFTELMRASAYAVRVIAVRGIHRIESEPLVFVVEDIAPPTLVRFSADDEDLTCVVLEWTHGDPAESYEVVVIGYTEDETFAELLPAAATGVEFCATEYPIVDGMSYTAQVFALLGSERFGSNVMGYTTNFTPGEAHSASGRWLGDFLTPFDAPRTLEMTLEDENGVISGTCTIADISGEPYYYCTVSGTRVDMSLELVFTAPEYAPIYLSGSFTVPDTIEATLNGSGAVNTPVTLIRDDTY
jgi:hypothetical protein